MRRLTAKLAALGLLCFVLVIVWYGDAGDRGYVVETIPVEPAVDRVESRLLFGGDVYWGRLFERNAPNDYAFPFSGLDSLSRDRYNAWIVNLECPVTDEFVPFDSQWEAIQFNCRPEYLEDAAKWFDVVSLANNHTDNVRGQEGLDITRQNLERVGIQHFGHFEPGIIDDLCEVTTVSATARMDDGTLVDTALPVALCGYHGVFRTFTDEEIAHLSKYSEHFITIVMPHAGVEYVATSDANRRSAYRGMIDAGADAVIGGHPHWVQTSEAYRGKLIVYSMGNFIFDQQFNSEVTRSAMIDARIEIEYSETLQPYLDIATECIKFKDQCLDLIADSGATKPKIALEYEVIPTRTTNLITSLDADGLQSILDRMNWQTTLAGLE